MTASDLSFELYWSFRSPYSYLATGRYVDLVTRYDVACDVRPVYPIAIRDPEFFDRVNPMWPPYLMRDTLRIAQMNGIPYRYPRPDPVVQQIGVGIAKEQPYIHRLTRLGIAAVERGCGLAFIDNVSRTIWSGEVENWHEGDHLARAADAAGLDLAELDAAIEKDPQHFEDAIEANQRAHAEAGHWGVPTAVFRGEPFFGQDRIDHLIWRLEQNGLALRV
ncbi:MAG: DsbA family protein [Thermoleophilia bacterium]|nr:DsbA family protein [Thermoleophilia bacterium]